MAYEAASTREGGPEATAAAAAAVMLESETCRLSGNKHAHWYQQHQK
jgi:hypothetical protein